MAQLLIMAGSLILTLTVNALANILPLGGVMTAQISDKYMNYFTPAPYVFSIWGLIYLLLIANLIFLFIKRKTLSKYITKIFPWYLTINIANAVWMFTWHYDIIWATVPVMLVILFGLIKLFLITKEQKNASRFIRYPISLYLGWISVATVANISVFLTYLNFINDFRIIISIVIFAVVTTLGIYHMKKNKDFIFPLVIVWALVGIAVRFNWVETILYSSLIAATTVLVPTVYFKFKKSK